MAPQVAEIIGQFRADWVIGSLFGRSPSVSIKEFKKAGSPLNRVIKQRSIGTWLTCTFVVGVPRAHGGSGRKAAPR